MPNIVIQKSAPYRRLCEQKLFASGVTEKAKNHTLLEVTFLYNVYSNTLSRVIIFFPFTLLGLISQDSYDENETFGIIQTK